MEVLSVVYITKAAGLQLLLLSYHRMYFSEQRPVAREGERERGGERESERSDLFTLIFTLIRPAAKSSS